MKKRAIERELDIAFYSSLLIGCVAIILFYISQMVRTISMSDPLLSRLYLSHGFLIIALTIVVLAIVLKRPRDSGHLHIYGFVMTGALVAANLHTVIATAEPFNALGLLVVGMATGCVMLRVRWFAASFGLVVLSYLYVDWFYPVTQINMLAQSTAAYASIVLTIAVFVSRRFSHVRIVQAQHSAREANAVLEQQLEARMRAENSLRLAQQRLEIVMNQVPFGIFWKDRDHRFLGCNRKFAEFYGKSGAEALITKTDDELYNDTEFTNCITKLEDHIMETGESSLNAVTPFVREGGKLTSLPDDSEDAEYDVVYRTCRMPLYDSEGRSIGILGTVEDITEDVRRQAEESEMDQKLLTSQKFESLGALSGGIAHEFNNILVGVLGNADYMKFKLDEEFKLHKNLDGIIESAHRASQLIQQMLLYSGRREIQKGQLNLNQTILDLDGIIRASVSKRVTLQYELDPDLPTFTADGGQLRQMIVNLVMNASESFEDGDGVITVRTGVGTIHDQETDSNHPSIFLEVEDNGCGMDERTEQRIFDPFFTTKFMGRGLGMSAVRGIVHAHGGSIDIATSPGNGTTVRVHLLNDNRVTEPQEPEVPGELSGLAFEGEGTALLIDDERMVIKVTTLMLESIGYRVVSALDGKAGMRLFNTMRDRLRLVIIDRTMPGMSGEDVVAAIRELDVEIPILLCSGYSDEGLSDAILNDRMTTTLHKPFKQSELEKKIRSLAVVQ